MPLLRLDKFIASQVNISRSDVRDALQKNRVTVNEKVVRNGAVKIDTDRDRIALDGKTVGYSEFVCIMMNKPAGVLSASRDPKAMTVVDLVPTELKRKNLFPAGRLDKDSVGLIVLTDDGQLCHRMLSPKKEIYKTYFVRLDGVLPSDAKDRFASGIVLEDGTECLPARLYPVDSQSARVEICEGKFHQVKRMFQSIGLTVTYLKRERIGGLVLDESLSEGECRLMTEEETSCIFN